MAAYAAYTSAKMGDGELLFAQTGGLQCQQLEQRQRQGESTQWEESGSVYSELAPRTTGRSTRSYVHVLVHLHVYLVLCMCLLILI